MTTKFIFTAIAFLMLTACNNQNKGATALSDPQQQEVILDSIAANPVLLQKVYSKAQAKDNSGNMGGMNMNGMDMGDSSMMGMGMMNNPKMMGQMMDMMMQQCAKDTAMCRQMCIRMMNNPKMIAMMQSMMKSKNMDTTRGKMNMGHH